MIADDLIQGQAQYLENITRTKNGVETRNRVYVMCEGTMEEQYKALKDIETQVKSTESLKLSIIATEPNSRTSIRKLTEIVFLRGNTEINIFAPKSEQKNKKSENKFDTLLLNSANKSYSDMLKVVRDNIDPDRLGLNIKNMKKMKNESLLIVTEKGHTEVLAKEIRENSNTSCAGIEIVDKKCEIIISGMDAVTTREEITSALLDRLNENSATKIQIKSLYTNRIGEQVATVTTTKELADKIIEGGPIKIGWSPRCMVKEKITISRCMNCLRVGHMQQHCKSMKSQTQKCLRCTKEGHKAKDCQEESHCNSCSKDGHRADSMSCPKYRKLVNNKERSTSKLYK